MCVKYCSPSHSNSGPSHSLAHLEGRSSQYIQKFGKLSDHPSHHDVDTLPGVPHPHSPSTVSTTGGPWGPLGDEVRPIDTGEYFLTGPPKNEYDKILNYNMVWDKTKLILIEGCLVKKDFLYACNHKSEQINSYWNLNIFLIVITANELGPIFIFIPVRATKKMVKIDSLRRVFK